MIMKLSLTCTQSEWVYEFWLSSLNFIYGYIISYNQYVPGYFRHDELIMHLTECYVDVISIAALQLMK